jgi:glycosyltransferase involved in cell wall biosynthesis
MTISVGMPTYNRAYVIGDALASCLAQSYADFEVIIVDDGSRDDTSDVVAQFRDPRIRYIRNEQNRGVAAARNIFVREARGELISFLDSDDLWKPSKLEKEVAFLERHPEAGAVFEDLEKQDNGTFIASFQRETPYFSIMLAERSYPHEIVFTQREMYLCLLREVCIKPTALTMRAQVIRDTGRFDENWRAGSDWEFLFRASRLCRFGYIDEPLAVLRLQNDATHRLYSIENKSLQLALYKQELLQLKDDMEAVAAAKRCYCDLSKHIAWAYLAGGQESQAAKTFAQAFRETGNASMLAHALFAYVPPRLRSSIKKLARKGEAGTSLRRLPARPDSTKPS